MSLVTARRAELRREIRRRVSEVVPGLREQMKRARAERRKRVRKCAADGKRKRARAMKGAQDARQRLRDRIARAREKARAAVKACKVSAKETELAELDRLLQELERERVEIYSLRMKANQLIDERGRRGGRRAAELRAESDDEVRRDLGDDQELEALWEKVKHKIKGSARRSRTEAFLEYVHDHPEDLDELRAQQELQWEREAEELFKTMGEHEAVGKLDQDELEQYGRELDQAERLTGEVPF